MQDPLIYLHIPKTAGTSFRVSAEKFYGKANVLRDYGADSVETSAEIIETYYDGEDLTALRQRGLSKKFLCGHFSLPRYRQVFPDSPVMTFFREPVKRVVSEFVHFTNHYDYTGSLEEFYCNTNFQNRQHRSLCGAKPTDLDFFGITEKYSASLKLFNQRYSTAIKNTVLNKGAYGSGTVASPSPAQIREIEHLNQADMALYQLALEAFDNQSAQTRVAKNMGTRYQGNVGGIQNNKLYGWITDATNDSTIILRVAVNGVYHTTVKADKSRPDLKKKGIHDTGKCGFEVQLEELGILSNQDSISIVTEDGLFELPNSPLVLAA